MSTFIQEPACVYALSPFLCTHSSRDRDVHYRARLYCSVLNESAYCMMSKISCIAQLLVLFRPVREMAVNFITSVTTLSSLWSLM